MIFWNFLGLESRNTFKFPNFLMKKYMAIIIRMLKKLILTWLLTFVLGNRVKSTWIQKSTELFSHIVCIGQDIFCTKIGKILKNDMLFQMAVKLFIRQPISTTFRYVRNN